MKARAVAFRDFGILIVIAALLPAVWFETAGWRLSESASQSVYRSGVPHTDREGNRLTGYETGQSFFPIGLYHALTGVHHGQLHALTETAAAGFNTVHFWEGQKLADVAEAARQARLQIIYHNPSDAEVRRFAGHSTMLSWYLDEEPTLRFPEVRQPGLRRAFEDRKRAIHGIDPGRPVLVIDGPPGRFPVWDAWATVGDVVSFSVYPVYSDGRIKLGGQRSIAETVARAVRLNQERKPVWFVAQAFASPALGWRMPTAREYRSMIYTAIVHGATGVIAFAYDSFVTRDGQVLGIAPSPLADYGETADYDGRGDSPLVVDSAALAESRMLWHAAAGVNAELAELTPALLNTTAPVPYRVSLRGLSEYSAPIRTLLKQDGDRLLLIAVNLDGRRLDARFAFDDAIIDLNRPFSPEDTITAENNEWQARFEPYETRVYRFSLRAPGFDAGGPES